MLDEDLDDTHLCIKCSATIVGLDNYIQHSKTNCGSKATTAGYGEFEYPDAANYTKTEVEEASAGKASKSLNDPYDLPYELGADVFFSSLQLQSVQASSGGKANSAQQILTRKATATLLSSGRDETGSGDWQEEVPTNNTDNLMKVVRDIGETKKFEPVFKPIAFAHGSPEPDQSDDEDDDDEDFEDDDDDDEDYVPTPYSGGKWKPGSQPAPRNGGKWKSRPQAAASIPATHTGGKWKFKSSTIKAVVKPAPETSSDRLLSEIRAKLKSSYVYIPKEVAEGFATPEVDPEAGGKWKPGFSKFSLSAKLKPVDGEESPEVLEAQTGGKWKPGHGPAAGNNWKPGGSKTLKLLLPPVTGAKFKPNEGYQSLEILETQTGGKWKPGQGPTTGGKWKPEDRPVDLKISQEPEPEPPAWDDQEPWGEDVHPPLDHTKGKWVPGTKVERLEYKEEVLPPPQDFWCNICCRKLKTKSIYEKHLKSGGHSRKSETEQQLERAAVEQLQLSQQILRPPALLLERSTSSEPDPDKRKRRKTFIKCEICKHRVQRYLVGKHLISHYHYVRMSLNPKVSFGMILDNIHAIVLQSPFQCSPCRFYANTEENFLNHWNSAEHRDRTEGPGKFWCSFCRFECEDNNQMRRHLLSADHGEVILAINRSVPIYISKKVAIECPKCHQCFRYNMELRQHSLRCDGAKGGTASDEYQSRFRCKICPDEVLKSKVALQRHEKFKHNQKRYYCSVCEEEFENPVKAVKHRKLKEHRIKAERKLNPKSSDEISEDLRCEKCGHLSSSDVEAMLHQITHPSGCTKNTVAELPIEITLNGCQKCSHCVKAFNTKNQLKFHLNTAHPEIKHVCPLCGEAFALPRELGSHKRSRLCVPQPTSNKTNLKLAVEKSWSCSDCSFRSAYESELIFHRIVHTEGVEAFQYNKKLKCPLCERSFTKHSLRYHLRQHTNEKIFVCEICNGSFTRRHNYKDHMQFVHGVGGEKQRMPRRSERFVCDTCGKTFTAKHTLRIHMTVHMERDEQFRCTIGDCQYNGRNEKALKLHKANHTQRLDFICPEKGCKYRGKTKYYLSRHQKIHTDIDKFYNCPECDFKAKVPGHIRRHVRVHTKECPYKCPHCDYKSGYIENLRKHVLTTKKHPGKFIYQCDKCDPPNQFQTNFSSDYQVHMTSAHPSG